MSVAVLVCAGSIPTTANAGAGPGKAGHGAARPGKARLCEARQGTRFKRRFPVPCGFDSRAAEWRRR